MNPSSPSPGADILVVDDTPANLQLLVGMLKEHGFKVRPVPGGELALRAVQAHPPDLILLDINMPDMDGYEVLRRLRANPAAAEIPVLFISALNETADKVRAFQAGGVDYVTKPFQLEEVVARVRTHLAVRRQKLELKRSLDQLRELERLRDDLTHMIVHDMRSPLLGLQLTVDLLMMSATPENEPILTTSRQAVASLIEMVSQVLDVSRLEAGRLELKKSSGDLAALVAQTTKGFQLLAEGRNLSAETAEPLIAEVDEPLLKRVLANLIGNALKFTPKGGNVSVRVKRSRDAARIEVVDNGPGIALADQKRIFEKFGQLDGAEKRRGFGLGLAFARMAVEAHGGTIGVESSPGRGSNFWFTLPLPTG